MEVNSVHFKRSFISHQIIINAPTNEQYSKYYIFVSYELYFVILAQCLAMYVVIF